MSESRVPSFPYSSFSSKNRQYRAVLPAHWVVTEVIWVVTEDNMASMGQPCGSASAASRVTHLFRDEVMPLSPHDAVVVVQVRLGVLNILEVGVQLCPVPLQAVDLETKTALA